MSNPARGFRIGEGWDRHRLVEGRMLIIGGVEVPSDLGCDAHSDGDVLLHALTDAVLGAAARGDIGDHFPPADPRWKDAHSARFLKAALAEAGRAGLVIVNADATIVLEAPSLRGHKAAIRTSVARILGVDSARVGIKAKSGEGIGPTGRRECIEARAVVLLAEAE